jgi:hypothetical protein
MTAWTPFHADDEAAGETMRVYPSGPENHQPSGFESQPSGPPYLTASSGAPYGAPVAYGPPLQQAVSAPPPARSSSVASMFMMTVMVVVVVAGAVSVVYLLTGNRGGGPQAAPAAPAAAVSAPAASAPPPAASSAASRIDGCVVGEWANISDRVTVDEDTALTTDNGGMLRLRADGTGEIDFGSGVTLKGKLDGVTSEALLIGKITFKYETTGQTLNAMNVQSDARRVVFQSGKTVANERVDARLGAQTYTCAGDSMKLTSDIEQAEYRRT